MAKFIKRLKKSIDHVENALVVGKAFGYLDQLPNNFNTVFIHNDSMVIKDRNVVNIASFDDIELSSPVHIVFLDLEYIPQISKLMGILSKQRPYLAIEGHDVIERPNVECLYKAGYRAIDKLDSYHLWKKIK